MIINYDEKKIELTKTEMNEAKKYGSQMYTDLMNARRDNPDYAVAEIKAKRVKTPLDKLTMAKMRAYVKAHGTPEQKQMFLDISTPHYTDEGVYAPALPFFDVKKWFLNDFPGYREAIDKREKEMAILFREIDRKIADAKAAAEIAACAQSRQEAEDYLQAS